MTRTLGWVVSVALATAVLTGCGQEERSPVADSPGLAVALEKIDQAVVAGRLPLAQRYLADLRATTERSREAGVLDAAEAERITEAADALAAAMRTVAAPPPAPKPTPTPTPAPTAATAPAPAPQPAPAPGPTDGGSSGNPGGERGGPPPGKGAETGKGEGKGGP